MQPSLEQVVETASGLAPEEEAQFMQQRSAAASATVSDAFKAEVRHGVRRQTVGARLVCPACPHRARVDNAHRSTWNACVP